MKPLRYGRVLLVLMVLVLFVSPVFSQEAVMMLNHQVIGAHERAPVKFNHEQHSGKLECKRCHHDYDEYLNNKGGEDTAQACTACHGAAGKKNLPPLTEAFHAQCKKCHEELRAEKKSSGPVMCGECHVKK